MSEVTNRSENTAAGVDGWLKVIEDWFKARCNGHWEHRFGFSLETTDNPGWWASFQLYTTEAEANSVLADSPHLKDVDLSLENGHIRIYSELLSKCFEACAQVMAGAEQSLVQKRADVAATLSIRILIGWIEDDEHPRLCDEGEFGNVDAEVSKALHVLGYSNSVKILSDETYNFDLNVVRQREPYATTLVLIRTLPIKPVELACPRTGLAVYEQREEQFVLVSSACKFHEDGKIAIKGCYDEQGNEGVYYSLIIRDISSSQFVNIPLQK